MIKGIYISNHNLNDKSSGVTKKIQMQLEAFKKNNILLEAPNLFCDTVVDKIIRRIPFLKCSFDKAANEYISESIKKGINFVYIRHSVCSIHLISLLKVLKKNNIKIIYEFPTFPYDRNGYGISWSLFMIKDKFSRNKLHKYVDIGVNFSGYSEIYGVKCISINNGINAEEIKIRKANRASNKSIKFLGVALLAYWNGYDRLINAIHSYYSTVNNSIDIEFHIAGHGDAFNSLKALVKKNKLENRVIFHGFISGDELNQLYDNCDVGIGTLAPSRKYKGHIMSTLKTKEYTAKGMPFIKADFDSIFDNKSIDFLFNVKDDESPIDICEIIQWYNNLVDRYGEENLVNHIRSFAEKELSWEKQLKPIFDYINRELN